MNRSSRMPMRITTSWPIAVVACVLILIGIGSNTAHAAFAPELVAALSSRQQHQHQHRHQHHPDSRTTTILATTTSSGPGSATTGDSRDDKDECAPSKSPLLLSRRIFTTRSVVATATAVTSSSIVVPLLATLILTPEPAVAGIDMTSLTTTPIEGDATGAASRRKQLQPTAPTTTQPEGTVYLDNTGGVSYTEAYAGAVPGGRNRRIRNGVQKQFNVAADLRISTRTGLTLYSTRDDNQANELAWKVGTGDFPAGAEAGMLGMRLGSIRRIEVPSDLIFAARNAGTLPELTTTVGRERYEDLLRSGDATLIFDVRVTGINPGDSRI